MKNSIFYSFLALTLTSGCAMKQKILDVNGISMTHQNVPDGQRLQEVGPVAGKFCPKTFKDKGAIGLLDESVRDAQNQYKIDFILNAAFYRAGACVEVEGTGARLVSKTH